MDDEQSAVVRLIHLADQRLVALSEKPPAAAELEGWVQIPARYITLLGPIAKSFQSSTVWVKALEMHPDDAAILEKSRKFVDSDNWTRAFGHINGEMSVNARFREVSIPVEMPPLDPVTAAMAMQLAMISHQLHKIEEKLDLLAEVAGAIRRDQVNEDFAKALSLTGSVDRIHTVYVESGTVTQTDWDELPRHRDLEERHVKTVRTLDDHLEGLNVQSVKDAKRLVDHIGPEVLEQLFLEWELLRAMAQLAELRSAVRLTRGEPPREDELAPALSAFREASDLFSRIHRTQVDLDTVAQQTHRIQEKERFGGLSLKKVAQPLSGLSSATRSLKSGGATAGAVGAVGGAGVAGARVAATTSLGAAGGFASAALGAAPLLISFAASKGVELTARKHDRIEEQARGVLNQIKEASATSPLLTDPPERALLDFDRDVEHPED